MLQSDMVFIRLPAQILDAKERKFIIIIYLGTAFYHNLQKAIDESKKYRPPCDPQGLCPNIQSQ